MTNVRCALIAVSLTLVSGCDEDPVEVDGGGGSPDAGIDAAVEPCVRDRDCDDELFCTVHRCVPGAGSADARGCVLTAGPCGPGELCDEAGDTCSSVDCENDPDPDVDGRPSFACGGDDCDDMDANRYPGNDEVCDPEGHDEDCRDETVAGASDGDIDGDGFVSAACCNGAVCGDDCDDADRATFPGARELCNGRDDDCDGVTDEESDGPICPGGTCRGGHCDLEPWARTFGADVAGVAMDDAGNVYLAGSFGGSVDFGGADGAIAAENPPDIYLASYGPDGRYRWVNTFGAGGGTRASAIAFDPAARLVYAVGFLNSPVDLGSGPMEGAFLVAYDLDGAHRWSRGLGYCAAVRSVAASSGPIVTASFSGPCNVGGAELFSSASYAGLVVHYGADGEHRWEYHTEGSLGAETDINGLSVAPDGSLVIAGRYASNGDLDFGGGARPSTLSAVFAVGLESEGRYRWEYATEGGFAEAEDVVVRRSGEVNVVGSFRDGTDFGGGPQSARELKSFLLTLGSSGSFTRFESYGDGGSDEVTAVALDSAGNLVLAGTFSGVVNFGGGDAVAPDEGAAFIAVFDEALNHRWDRVYTFPGFPAVRTCSAPEGCASAGVGLAIGPADSMALVGTFRGYIDLGPVIRGGGGTFVTRLGN